MNTFLHVLSTWFASILTAFLILFLSVLIPGEAEGSVGSYLLPVLFAALVAGLPSFFISWAFLALIQQTFYSSYEKLFLWLLAAVVTVVLNVLILCLTLAGEILSVEVFFIFWPAYAGVVVTILLRLKQFFSLINKTTPYEANMV